jgi:hypothetical protein
MNEIKIGTLLKYNKNTTMRVIKILDDNILCQFENGSKICFSKLGFKESDIID